MPIKKKVKFDDKNEYKRYKKESESEQSEEDNLNQSDDDLSKKKSKHTLDSDEEDNTDKYEVLNRDALNDIGQEAKTAEFDDQIKLTPFNMREELEEGDFDKEGYYHWKRDKSDIKDAWLDNIDWANINTFKKSNQTEESKMSTGTPKTSNEEDESENSESESESVYSEDDEKDQIEMFKKILPLLKPGETILKAIKRLGNSSKSSGTTGSLSASQRWSKKKNQSQASSDQDSEKVKADKETLEKLTSFANFFIDKGFYDIYEETYEKLEKKIKGYDTKPEDKDSFDMFADDVDEKDLKAATSNDKQDSLIQDTIVKWIYKLTNEENAKILGPFTSQQMLEKSEKGEFKETGVWCRKVDDSSSTFYNSKRIDFDLYT